jgi:large subunit ribosomal protein L25
MPISVESKEMKQVLSSGENVLVDLKIEIGKKRDKRLVMVKEYALHPLTDRLWHVDLYEVSLKEAIKVEVPINFTGEAEGVKIGGILNPLLRTIEVSCLPEQIPEQIEVDCTALNIGDTLHVSDLSIASDIEVINDASTAVVTVSPPEVEEVEVVEEELEEEEEKVAEAEEAPAEEAEKE